MENIMDNKIDLFDDVIVISVNKIGLVYAIDNGFAMVKTSDKMIKTKIEDLKKIYN